MSFMSKSFSFKYEEVPYGWAMCFNDNCERRESCLRRQAAELSAEVAPKERRQTMCVTPLAYVGGSCTEYKALKTERLAWGFNHLYDKVLKAHYQKIKDALVKYLNGMSNYYRYRNGELKLSESQQQHVAQLFSRYGYNDTPVFDHYELKTVF